MTDASEHDLIQHEFEAVHRKLDRLDEAIRGPASNGSKPGILTRLDRLEQDAKRHSRLIWLIVGTLSTALGTVLVGWLSGGAV